MNPVVLHARKKEKKITTCFSTATKKKKERERKKSWKPEIRFVPEVFNQRWRRRRVQKKKKLEVRNTEASAEDSRKPPERETERERDHPVQLMRRQVCPFFFSS